MLEGRRRAVVQVEGRGDVDGAVGWDPVLLMLMLLIMTLLLLLLLLALQVHAGVGAGEAEGPGCSSGSAHRSGALNPQQDRSRLRSQSRSWLLSRREQGKGSVSLWSRRWQQRHTFQKSSPPVFTCRRDRVLCTGIVFTEAG